jgi:Phosphotransferase enzyme family
MLAEPLDWVHAHVAPTGPVEIVRSRAWATTVRIPTAGGQLWLKVCSQDHGAFEPELLARLAVEQPALVPRVLAHDAGRRFLLLADAGVPFDHLGNPPGLWLRLLPRYAELQRTAVRPASLPDRTLARWPELFEELAASPLPLEPCEASQLRAHARRFTELCAELAAYELPAAIQHDDLHHKNAFVDGEELRIIDWGDASWSHPFASLVVIFRFLEERTRLAADDPWFARLRDAYLEPWGPGLAAAFDICQRIGRFAHAFGWLAVLRLLPAESLPAYDVPFAVVLRRALAVA